MMRDGASQQRRSHFVVTRAAANDPPVRIKSVVVVTTALGDVRFWHKVDITTRSTNVRFWG